MHRRRPDGCRRQGSQERHLKIRRRWPAALGAAKLRSEVVSGCVRSCSCMMELLMARRLILRLIRAQLVSQCPHSWHQHCEHLADRGARADDHLRNGRRDQHGAWRIHHAGCVQLVHLQSYLGLPFLAVRACVIRDRRGRRPDPGTGPDPLSVQTTARHVAGDIRCLPCADAGSAADIWQRSQVSRGAARSSRATCSWGSSISRFSGSLSWRSRSVPVVALWALFYRTRFGVQVRAVMQNKEMAASFGINSDRVYMLTFALGAGLAGLAGSLFGVLNIVLPTMGASYVVQAFLVVVVGGGTLAGSVVAGGRDRRAAVDLRLLHQRYVRALRPLRADRRLPAHSAARSVRALGSAPMSAVMQDTRFLRT